MDGTGAGQQLTVEQFLRGLGVASAADFVAQVQNLQTQQTAMGQATTELQGALARCQQLGAEAEGRATRAESERDKLVRALADRTRRSGGDGLVDGEGIGKPSTFIEDEDEDETFVVKETGRSRISGLADVRCALCSAMLIGDMMVREHERSGHEPGAFRCATCDKCFRCSEDLRRHSRSTRHAIHVRFRLAEASSAEVWPNQRSADEFAEVVEPAQP